MSVDRQQLGETIRRLRDAAGLSQHELSAKLDLTRSSIANIEAGRQNVGLDKLAVLADGLGTTVSALLAEDGDRLPVSTALLAKVAGQQRDLSRTLSEMAELMLQLAAHSERMERQLAEHGIGT